MKKIGIILFANMRYSPFLQNYIDLINCIPDWSYEVIYFNRYRNLKEIHNEQFISIPWIGKGTNAAHKFEKALNFYSYKWQVISILNKKKYDFLIVLTTVPGVLLGDYLIKKYKNKFILDIRDFTKEQHRAFFRKEQLVINNSALNIISSPGFKDFLPKGQYELMHNFNSQRINQVNSKQKIVEKKLIRIGYVGSIAYVNNCIKLIDLVQNDNRFEFYFYGNESINNEVSTYVKKIDNDKIKMMGAFTPDQKEGIYKSIDMVFNCYGNKSKLVKCAVSNKHYDGAMYKCPVLVSPDTIMQKLAGNFGFALDLDSIDSLDNLYEWYQKLDWTAYERFAQNVIEQAIEDNKVTSELIIKTITQNN